MDVEALCNDLRVWWERHWGDGDGSARPDDVEAVRAIEAHLEVELHPLLRFAFTATSLRESQQIHLRALAELEVSDGVLVFGDEQQHSFSYGVDLADLAEPNPQVIEGLPGGEWSPMGLSLAGFLKYLWLTNRPYTPPFFEGAADGAATAAAGWDEVRFGADALPSFWTRGGVVTDGIFTGAPDADALLEALRSVGIRVERDDLTGVD